MTRRFGTLFWRQILRPSWRHPFLTGLNVLSIALGITVFLAIQIANRGAITSFRSAAELTTGKSDLEIRGDIPDDLFPLVAKTEGVRAATPLVEGVVTLPDKPGDYLRILGVDPFSGGEFFSFSLEEQSGASVDLEKWLSQPDAVAVSSSTGQGQAIRVLAGSSIRTLKPIFVFKPKDSRVEGDSRMAAMDIAWAQELLGYGGRLSSIQILLTDPSAAQGVIERLRQFVPADVMIEKPAARSEEMESMLGAFQLNLTALSLVSIIVGMFLIFNSVGAAVVRRRVEVAILRSCGATRWEIRGLFLGEAAIEAIAGAAIGLVLAPLLTALISQPISQSVSSIYELVRIEDISLTGWQVTQAFGIGIVAALLAAWVPASEAARCDPARVLHPGAPTSATSPLRGRAVGFAAGLLLLAGLLGLLALHGGAKVLGFASAAAVMAGFSLLVPWLTMGVAAGFRWGLLTRMAADHLTRSLHRNAMTIAALAAAVAMTISVTVMIHSFRASVQRWIGHTLMADLYLAPAGNDTVGLQAFLPPGTKEWAEANPKILQTSTFREVNTRYKNQPVTLTVLEGKARGDIEMISGSADDYLAGKAVVLSESFVSRFGWKAGEAVTLPTPRGEETFAVAGIYKDFTRDRGAILMQRSLFQKYWKDERLHSLALKLRDPKQAEGIAEEFRHKFGSEGAFVVFDNASLRQRVFQIFDQTFAVTSVLRSIAVLVAVTGVLFSLSVLVVEREREIGVLRSVGASRAQILRIFLGEAGLIGLTACVSGLISGCVLAMVLTWVINKAFFGWTIDLTYPIGSLAAIPLWLIPAAVLAALIPAWRAAQIQPARALRFE
ncbi:ABC transporter permease [soil metagenome]